MYSKEAIKDAALAGGASPFVAGLVGGAGGGVSQVRLTVLCEYYLNHKLNSSVCICRIAVEML